MDSTKRASAVRMGLLRLTLSKYSRRLSRPVAAICATRKDSEPKALAVLSSAYTLSPAMAAPTMMTLATPMMTPSRVRKLRSLCARMESSARSEERRVGSDWSSDVCSSDLHAEPRDGGAHHDDTGHADDDSQQSEKASQFVRADGIQRQIGRAACR